MTVIQRPLRGSRISSFYPVKSLPALSSLDSAFQLQEYISLLIRLDVHDVDTIVSVPGKTGANDKSDGAADESKGEEAEKDKDRKSDVAVDEACWIYEQLRRLAQDLTHPLITMLQAECTRASCPEMKAGEWLYLCVAHGNDGAMEQCCAIDYILHTLDSATALLNSPRAFPSRLSVPPSSHRHFSSLARRLGRIFAHAYFHHREAFEQAEAESSLYARFLALTSKFELVPAEFLVIPTPSLSSGEGRGRDIEVQPPRLLGASVARHSENEISEEDPHTDAGGELSATEWDGKADGRGKSPPPGLSNSSPARGNEHSPRRYGRSRTDTMVFSEAFNVAEELAKEHGNQNQEQETAPTQSHERGEIAIEPADPVIAPETKTLLIPPIEPSFAQPAITVSSPEAPEFDSVPTEELFAPEDAPISATEIEPAPAPSAALAEELTASTSPFETPLEPATDAVAAVEPAPEVADEAEAADAPEISLAPDIEAVEEAAPTPNAAAEAETVSEPAAVTEEPGQKDQEVKELEEAVDSKAEAAPEPIKDSDFAVEVAPDVVEAHVPETETPVHAPEIPAPTNTEPAAEEITSAPLEEKPAAPEIPVASESHPAEVHAEIAVEKPEEPESSAPAPEDKPDIIASVPASKEEQDKPEPSPVA